MVEMITRSPIPRGRLMFLLLVGVVIVALSYPLLTKPEEQEPEHAYTVVNTFPHDPEAFTQGLVYHDGRLYEGTGLRGQSSIRIVEPETGAITRIHRLPPESFGERLTIH